MDSFINGVTKMEELINKIYEDNEFINIIKDILENETVQEMKNYRQHCDTSCFEHCLVASYYCYKYCKRHNLDYISCARAAMLHDLFLYDWRKRQDGRKGLHAFTHPKTAYENASKLFDLNEKEKDIITKHMWPITFFSFPKYRESFILTLVDKRCALNEAVCQMQYSQKRVFRFAYVFLGLLILKI